MLISEKAATEVRYPGAVRVVLRYARQYCHIHNNKIAIFPCLMRLAKRQRPSLGKRYDGGDLAVFFAADNSKNSQEAPGRTVSKDNAGVLPCGSAEGDTLATSPTNHCPEGFHGGKGLG